MSKKVWVNIIRRLLISLFLFCFLTSFLTQEAYGAAIDQVSDKHSCRGYIYSVKILGAFSEDRQSYALAEYYPTFSDHYKSSATFSNDDLCIDGASTVRSDIGDNRGFYFAGLLYVSSPITGQSIKLESWSNDRDEGTYARFSTTIYDIPETSASLFTYNNFATLKTQFVDMEATRLYGGVRADDKNDPQSITRSNSVTINPGVYVYAGMHMNKFENSDKEDGWSDLYYVKFGSDSSYDEDSNMNHVDANGNGYLIANRPLTALELNTVFKNNVETRPELCTLAGGVTSSAIPGICCGDDPTDENYMNPGTGHICLRSGSSWRWADAKEACELRNGVFKNEFATNFVARDATDGCCGDDGILDYYYVTDSNGRKQFLCYDYALPIVGQGVKKNDWYNAMVNSFRIVTTSNKVPSSTPPNYYDKGTQNSDIISNSQDWFVCNANGQVVSNAIKIAEGETFTERFSNGEYSCAAMMTSVFDVMFEEGCYYDEARTQEASGISPGPFIANCCKRANGNVNTASDIDNCQECYLTTAPDPSLPINAESIRQIVDPTNTITSDNSGLVDKDLCVNDPNSCLAGTINYNPDLSCEGQQVSLETELCNKDTHYCSGGTPFPTLETQTNSKQQCCIGSQAKCIEKSKITTIESCTAPENNGEVFGSGQSCFGTEAPLGNGLGCCFGTVYVDYSKANTYVQASKDSFICFKNNNDNIISQCCYDSTCANADYTSGSQIVQFNSRVLTKGSSIHTLKNYDEIKKTGVNLIEDKAYKFKIVGGAAAQGEQFFGPKTPIKGFGYLEFDVLTDSETIKVVINKDATSPGYEAGKLFDYSINGNKSNIWHHITIPTSQLSTLGITNITSIMFYDATAGIHYVIVDNIALVPSDLSINTKSHYCTGGFEGWIEDLDPPEGKRSDFKDYGPYMFACSGIASYSWTGTQCCGDDTKKTNNGEYYADTQYGCFAGTKILDDQTVPEAKNYYSSSDPAKDDITTAAFNDLIYYDADFIGCQVPSGKYSTLKVSYDGVTLNSELMDSNTHNQCTVIGKHYCMNGVWRNKVMTADGTEKEVTESDGVVLKISPQGAELIKNGFRG